MHDDQTSSHEANGLIYGTGRRFKILSSQMEHLQTPMCLTNPNIADNPLVFCNKSFQILTGYSSDDAVGRNCRFLQGPDSDQKTVVTIRLALLEVKNVYAELVNYKRNGERFLNALFISPIRDSSGTLKFYLASQQDITNRRVGLSHRSCLKGAVDSLVAEYSNLVASALKTSASFGKT